MLFYDDVITAVSKYTTKELVGNARDYDSHERFPEEQWRSIAKDLKLFNLLVSSANPAKGCRTFLEAVRIISTEFASLASIAITQGIYGIWTLQHFGTPLQKEKYLDKMVTTDLMVALAFSELDVDLEREYPRTIARQTEHGWELSGKKNMVSNVTLAGLIFVLAQTIDLKGNRGMRIVIVDAKSQGVKIGQSVDKVGVRAMPLAPIEFDNVLIGNDCLMSDSIEGRTQLQQILIKMRLAISAQSLGIAEGVFQKGLNYSSLKRGFGKRPIDVQINQFKFASMQIKLSACEAYYNEYIKGSMTDDRGVSILKVMTSSVAQEVADEVVRITGAYSFIADNDIERYVRDAQVTGLYGGATNTLNRKISEIWL